MGEHRCVAEVSPYTHTVAQRKKKKRPTDVEVEISSKLLKVKTVHAEANKKIN